MGESDTPSYRGKNSIGRREDFRFRWRWDSGSDRDLTLASAGDFYLWALRDRLKPTEYRAIVNYKPKNLTIWEAGKPYRTRVGAQSAAEDMLVELVEKHYELLKRKRDNL